MSGSKVTFQIHRDIDAGQWYVDKVETRKGPVRSVTSFTIPVPLRDVFDPEVADFLLENLPLRLDLAVRCLDRHICEGPGLVLSGIQIVAQHALGGLQTVTVRVKDAVGAVVGLYSPDYRFGFDPLATASGPVTGPAFNDASNTHPSLPGRPPG